MKGMKYKAYLSIMGQKLSAEGDTPVAAITGLKPKNVKGKAILTLERGNLKRERVLMPAISMRLFNSVGLNREITLKNISILFDGL